MAALLEIVTELEGTKITKAQLETTRLAKHINHLRRITSDDQLARRLKTLLKKWREMVIPLAAGAAPSMPQQQQQQPTTTINLTSSVSPPMQQFQKNPTTPNPRMSSHTIVTNGTVPSAIRTTSATTVGAAMCRNNNMANMVDSRKSYALSHQSRSQHGNSNSDTVQNSTATSSSNSRSHKLKSGPTSFANLISRASTTPSNQITISSASKRSNDYAMKSSSSFDDRSQSPSLMAKIPKLQSSRDVHRGGSAVSVVLDERSKSPLYLMGKRNFSGSLCGPVPQQPPHQLFQDKHNDSDVITVSTVPIDYCDESNNSRKQFNGNSRNNYLLPCSSSLDIHDTNSDSSSRLILPQQQLLQSNKSLRFSSSSTAPTVASKEREHKKHKKDKKKTRDKNKGTTGLVPSVVAATITTTTPTSIQKTTKVEPSSLFEPPDSLSSDSNTLFTTASMSNRGAFDASAVSGGGATTGIGVQKPLISKSDLTFTGKFRKATTDSTTTSAATIIAPHKMSGTRSNADDENDIINIDSSSSSSYSNISIQYKNSNSKLLNQIAELPSPVLLHGSHEDSQSCSPMVSMDNTMDNSHSHDYSSGVLHRSSNNNSRPSAAVGSLSEDTATESSLLTASAHNQLSQQQQQRSGSKTKLSEPKKRGRKKGSTGADRRLADTNYGVPGSQNYETVQLLGLKSKMDSIRGSTKKVKTTKELLAELQNRKSESGGGLMTSLSRTSSPTLLQSAAAPSSSSLNVIKDDAPSPMSASGKLFESFIMLIIYSFHFMLG